MKFSQSLLKIFTACLVLFSLSFQACKQLDNSDNSSEDQAFKKIDQYLDYEEINGFSGIISIKIKDKPLYSRSFGFANNEKEEAISENTVFDIGSLTKQFTAAGILKLEMEGKLNVQDTLGKFFPDIPRDKRGITLHELLTHTSGLVKSVGYDYERTSKTEFLQRLFASELSNEPGAKYNYSHAGYGLLGAVIEEVSDKNYESFLSEKIFLPAGMKNTGYVMPLWEEKQIAHGYRRCRDWGKPMDMPWASDGPYWNLKANGGLISSSSDILSWIETMEGTRILSAEAKEKFFYPHVKEETEGKSFYSYGWVILKSSRNTDVIAHDGGNNRFFTDLYRYVNEDVTILIFSNKDKPGNENISNELAKIVFWPNYEPEVQGVVEICMDSLPDNRIGIVAGNFLNLIRSEEKLVDTHTLDNLFSDYLLNKHSPDTIINVINRMKTEYRKIKIENVIVTDYSMMDLNLSFIQDENRKRLFIKLVFDEEDDFLIRMVIYNTRSH